jgi:hypothetical protein
MAANGWSTEMAAAELRLCLDRRGLLDRPSNATRVWCVGRKAQGRAHPRAARSVLSPHPVCGCAHVEAQ